MINPFEGHHPVIHPDAFVHEMAFVNGRVKIASEASVWPMVVIRGDINDISIGARSNIQDGSVLHVTHDSRFSNPGGEALTIGDDVTVGHNVTLHGCTLYDRCLIGMGSVVLDGAVVETHVMVGAGSLVPPYKTLENGYLYVGSPAIRARPLKDTELEFLSYSAEHYVRLARRTFES
jgi:carbonic anhydrase/acetyltransferase-like protein (isoleucine patch superfamily)